MISYSKKEDLSKKILDGISKVAETVASTMGPKGTNVLLSKKGMTPVVTKDGHTVVSFFELEDPLENTAVQILRDATTQTNKRCGDGTSTTTVLTEAILRSSQKYIASGVSYWELKKGIDKAVSIVLEELQKTAQPIQSLEQIKNIAKISANDSEIGELIAFAVDRIGKDGSITIETSSQQETTVDLLEGFRFEAGWISSHFATDPKRGMVEFTKPLILVTDHKISAVAEMLPCLQAVANEKRPLLIVADDVEDQALASLIMNTARGSMKVAAVRAPSFGSDKRDLLEDLSIAVGAKFFTKKLNMDLKTIQLVDLGSADRLEITRRSTTIMGGKKDKERFLQHQAFLKNQLKEVELEEAVDFQKRLSRLSSSIATIKLGGSTAGEIEEKKYRVEDALEAVSAAKEEGIIIGGGCALVRAGKKISEIEFDGYSERCGAMIIQEAISRPLEAIVRNANGSFDVVLEHVLNSDNSETGFDASENQMKNLLEAGIVDPVKVTKNALLNAVSAATLLINAKYSVIKD